MRQEETSRSELSPAGVFDIETASWDQYMTGCLRLATGETFTFDHDRESAFVDRLLAQKGVIYGHWAGRFDTLWFAQHIAVRGIPAKPCVAGQRIVSFQVADLEIRDSGALVPIALDRASAIGEVRKSKTGLECTCGQRRCGGYCRVRRGMPSAELAQLRDYMVVDCEATLSMLCSLQDYATQHDLDLRMTIGASAWATARRWMHLEGAPRGKQIYDRTRAGYFGGRVLLARPQAAGGHRADINSSYPASLERTRLPEGKRKRVGSVEVSRAFEACKEGICRAVVRVKNCFIPPLPCRTKDRIAYPIGEFQGSWTRLELAYALGNGATIIKMLGAVVYENEGPTLKFFARRLWDLRRKVIEGAKLTKEFAANPKKHPLAEWLKLYSNSLTGKLAQRPEVEQCVLNPPPRKIRSCPANAPCGGSRRSAQCGKLGCCPHVCTGACKRWRPLDPQLRIWSFERNQIPECGHVEWAAYLTAAARVEQHEQFLADGSGGETVIYGDTDSCYSTEKRERRSGDELGEWAYEGRLESWQAPAPKVYRYFDPDKGKWIVRAKGIPEAEDHWDELVAGQEIPITRGVNSFKTAARLGHLFSAKHTHRKISPDGIWFGDRRRDGCVTVPVTLDELEDA